MRTTQDKIASGESLHNTALSEPYAYPDRPQDIIADLCHYWHSIGLDPIHIVFTGLNHFEAESAN